MRARAPAVAALLLASAAATAQDALSDGDPAQVMAKLEQRLLVANRVVVEATIQSRGFIASDLRGRTELLDRNRANVAYTGTFAGKPADLALAADGRLVQLMNGPQTRQARIEAESNRAIIVGLARMGLLHNLARLTGLGEPDHAQGGVADWVKLDNFRPTTFAQFGALEGTTVLGYDLVVAGITSGGVRLWLDPATNLPRRRALTVRFGQSEMEVTEDYTRFEVE